MLSGSQSNENDFSSPFSREKNPMQLHFHLHWVTGKGVSTVRGLIGFGFGLGMLIIGYFFYIYSQRREKKSKHFHFPKEIWYDTFLFLFWLFWSQRYLETADSASRKLRLSTIERATEGDWLYLSWAEDIGCSFLACPIPDGPCWSHLYCDIDRSHALL